MNLFNLIKIGLFIILLILIMVTIIDTISRIIRMKISMNKFLKESNQFFKIGFPMLGSQLSFMIMSATDTIVAGRAGAEQLAEIREIIEHDKVACVFSEPQFNPDIINAVAKDMKIKTGVLDPLGATLDPGKNLYFDLIKNMSNSFKGC